MFLKKTDETRKLRQCFLKAGNLKAQSKKWFNELKSICHNSFRKIIHNSKVKVTETSILLEKRRKCIQGLKNCEESEREKLNDELNQLENQVSELVARDNRNKVVDNFQSISDRGGKLTNNNMWKLKRKVFPKNKETLPFAKKDCDGKLVTSHQQLKELYLDTFVHRLRSRPTKKAYSYLRFLKEKLWSKRLEYAKRKKSKDWQIESLDKVLKSLKTTKAGIHMDL